MPAILSIDPGGIGGNTGIFWGFYDEDKALTWHPTIGSLVIPGGFNEFLKYITDWNAYLEQHEGDMYVAVEDFTPRRGALPKSYEPAQIVGAVRYATGNRAFIFSPSFKDYSVSDWTLRNLGLYSEDGKHHDLREATRHAVRLMKNVKHVPTIKKGYPNVDM